MAKYSISSELLKRRAQRQNGLGCEGKQVLREALPPGVFSFSLHYFIGKIIRPRAAVLSPPMSKF